MTFSLSRIFLDGLSPSELVPGVIRGSLDRHSHRMLHCTKSHVGSKCKGSRLP